MVATSMKKVKLALEDHVKIGKRLKRARRDVLETYLSLCRSEGSRSSAAKAAKRSLGEIDNLRCRLDSLLCESLPAGDDSWKGVYYGDINSHPQRRNSAR